MLKTWNAICSAFCSKNDSFREFASMKKHISLAALLLAVCCAVFCLCSCRKPVQQKKSVSPETLRLMQKTQAELTACVERCRSAAEHSKDREILLALANSQEILAKRHETIINILLKKYKLERISTVAYPIELDPRVMVLPPVEEYNDFLAHADQQQVLREVLIALELTNNVLESDEGIYALIDPDAEEGFDLDFYLCPVCGWLSLQKFEENCPICDSDKDRSIELKDGEIPPRGQDSFVIGE